MSITVSDSSTDTVGFLGQQISSVEVNSWAHARSYGEFEAPVTKVTPSQRRGTVKKSQRSNPLRRLEGFLIETHGDESKVVLEEEGQMVEYFFPAELLKKNGVTLKNQPFELDEFMEDASLIFEIRPLADREHASASGIPLDPDRRRKLDMLLSAPEGEN
jgi:hypothetical protein